MQALSGEMRAILPNDDTIYTVHVTCGTTGRVSFRHLLKGWLSNSFQQVKGWQMSCNHHPLNETLTGAVLTIVWLVGRPRKLRSWVSVTAVIILVVHTWF